MSHDSATVPGDPGEPSDRETVVAGNTGPAANLPSPQRIGDFVIRSVIGEGGMGLVFQAEQQNPHRIVALKVLRPGFVTEKLLKRFEYEAEMPPLGSRMLQQRNRGRSTTNKEPRFALLLISSS